MVTGGTRGIGRGIVERFAEEGARVVFSGRDADLGSDWERSLRGSGLEVWFVRADSGIQDDVRGLVSAAIARGGQLDVLVNNAAAAEYDRGGVDGASDRPIHEVTDEVCDIILRVGLYGVLWACRYAVRDMLTRGAGSILNISSVATARGFPGTPIYSASKGALNALTKQMAVDYGRYGIRSNAILVGFVPAPGQTHPVSPSSDGALTGSLVAPWVGEPRDIANAALFLASDEAKLVTGALFEVDGGMASYWGGAMQGWDVMRPAWIQG